MHSLFVVLRATEAEAEQLRQAKRRRRIVPFDTRAGFEQAHRVVVNHVPFISMLLPLSVMLPGARCEINAHAGVGCGNLHAASALHQGGVEDTLKQQIR